MSVADARALLASVFGYPDFRPGQEAVVAAIAAGRNVLAIMPTGAGKSLLYQLPALMREGVTVVVSPLIALMRDQVRSLAANGVAAGALTSAHTAGETEAVMAALAAGRLKLLYLAPERLAAAGPLLARSRVSLLAVDEAHCVSQWGHDFRPDYLGIGALRATLGVQIAAFTATADPETRAEIAARLFPAPPEVFLGGFDRPNLFLAFAPKAEPRRQLLGIAARHPGEPGIVYCATRARTEALAAALRAAGRDAVAYHAGLDPDRRREVEARFQTEDALVVCATIAFGMGIDKPDIRFVAHADLPKSIEGYWQEAGRAGRDGAPADTLTLWGLEDVRFRRAQIDAGAAPPARKAADHARLTALLGLAEAPVCRRVTLMAHFGERAEPCGACDLCQSPAPLRDRSEAVRKALSAILRTGERFGVEHVVDVLRGEATAKVRAQGHDRLPTFGVGRELAADAWRTLLRQMAALDLVRADAARMGGLAMTAAARPVLRGEVPVLLREAPSAPSPPEARALVPEADAPLLAALRARRRALAEAQGVPAYIVFPDATLIAMAERRPATLDAMRAIPGVGAAKLARYGPAFLEVVTGTAPDPHPARLRLAGRPAGPLLDALAEAQTRLARGADGTGKYLACAHVTLARIAEARPRTEADLLAIPGMGPQKVERFGAAFLGLIREEAPAPPGPPASSRRGAGAARPRR